MATPTQKGLDVGMYGSMVACDGDRLPDEVDALVDLLEGDGSVSLDKGWDVVVRLLVAVTGVPLFESFVPVGAEIVYGPAQMLPADVVSAVAAELRGTPGDAVRVVLEGLDLDDAYPGIWFEEDARAGALETFEHVRRLFDDAASRSQSILFAVM